jgi:signal transduction histidine kinase
VEKESENEKEVILHFSVADTGIGIAPSDIQRIFEKFTQADGTSTRRYSGIGTGLTLSRQLIEMMGGRLWAESLPGKGSTFHFTVKVKPGKSVERKK